MKLAVVRAGALGDVILSLPALAALREQYPGAHIQAVGYPDVWQVAGEMVDSVMRIDSPTFSHLYAAHADETLHRWARGLDRIVAWTTRDPRASLGQSAVPVEWITPFPPPGMHATRWLLRSVAESNCPPPTPTSWRLPLSEQEIERGKALLRGLGLKRPVLIHPGAGAGWKRWPAAGFAGVANRLLRQGVSVALVEGPADMESIADVQSALASPLPVIRGLDTRILASVLSCASLFLGNDSGVTHLAAVAGTRVIALFGPTDPICWGPLGNSSVIRDCHATTKAQRQIRVCHDTDCMANIELEDVLSAIQKALVVA